MDKRSDAKLIFNKYAEEYEAKYMDVGLYHNALKLFCQSLETKVPNILEIGCGPGNLTRYLFSQMPESKIMGIDIAEKMISLAKKNNPGATFEVMDCREIDRLGHTFEGIVCGFCLPYLNKDEASRLISNISKLLKPGGVVYLSTMEVDSAPPPEMRKPSEETLTIHYHSGEELMRIFEKLELRVLKYFQFENPDNHTAVKDLVLLARK